MGLGRRVRAMPRRVSGVARRPTRAGRRPTSVTSGRACHLPRRSPRPRAWRGARPCRRRWRPVRRHAPRTRGRSGWRARPGRRPLRGASRGAPSRCWRRRWSRTSRSSRVGRAGRAGRVIGVVGVALGAVAFLVAGPGEGLVRGRFVVRLRGQRLGHRRVLLGAGGGGDAHRRTNRARAASRRWSGQSRDSGSTSTDQGASTPPSRSATGSEPRSTMFQRQRSARRAM